MQDCSAADPAIAKGIRWHSEMNSHFQQLVNAEERNGCKSLLHVKKTASNDAVRQV
jgi:hypothetical protein